jgi:hypothetical protein
MKTGWKCPSLLHFDEIKGGLAGVKNYFTLTPGVLQSIHQSHLQMDGLAQNCPKMPVVAGVLSFR